MGFARLPLFAACALALGLAACAPGGGRFDPIQGRNDCDFTPIGPTYPGAQRHLVGLQRAQVLGYTRIRGRDAPITVARLARPDGPTGDGVRRLSLAWTPDGSEAVACHTDASRVCVARVPPLQLALIVHFDPGVADAEGRTRTLVDYVKQNVVCAPEGVTGEDLQ